MSAYCYICGKGDKKDVYYTCNNCGGLVCVEHGYRCHYSKNCWCRDCLPTIAADLVKDIADVMENAPESMKAAIRDASIDAESIKQAARKLRNSV